MITSFTNKATSKEAKIAKNALLVGGDAYIEHFLLRFMCWLGKSIPWHFVTFLDEMVERGLLYRAGNSYLFSHHLLQWYLASLSPLRKSKKV